VDLVRYLGHLYDTVTIFLEIVYRVRSIQKKACLLTPRQTKKICSPKSRGTLYSPMYMPEGS
jgi:hypothetical protein